MPAPLRPDPPDPPVAGVLDPKCRVYGGPPGAPAALREKERQREALRVSAGASDSVAAVLARLAKTLEQLPSLVEQAIADLRSLLAVQQVDKGKELLALLVDGVVLHPVGGGLEAEIRGNVQGLLKLRAPGKRPGPECKLGGSGGLLDPMVFISPEELAARVPVRP